MIIVAYIVTKSKSFVTARLPMSYAWAFALSRIKCFAKARSISVLAKGCPGKVQEVARRASKHMIAATAVPLLPGAGKRWQG